MNSFNNQLCAPSVAYSVHHGPRINGAHIKFWALKKDATAAAKAIGWPSKSVERVHTRFCEGYALAGGAGQGFLTKPGYAHLAASAGELTA